MSQESQGTGIQTEHREEGPVLVNFRCGESLHWGPSGLTFPVIGEEREVKEEQLI